jgi:hypothetical protein
VVFSLVSLVVALFALFVNVAGLVRRPKISGNWGAIDDDMEGRRDEGIWIMVTARRRPIEVSEIGLMWLPKRTWRRQFEEWQLRNVNYDRASLDNREKVLTDGETMQTGMRLDDAIDDLGPRAGHEYCYVIGSGKVYFARPNSKLRRALGGHRPR